MFKQLCLLAILFALANTLNIQSKVTEEVTKNGESYAFVIFNNHVNFNALSKTLGLNLNKMDASLRGKLVQDSLQSVAKESQKQVIKYLKEKKN